LVNLFLTVCLLILSGFFKTGFHREETPCNPAHQTIKPPSTTSTGNTLLITLTCHLVTLTCDLQFQNEKILADTWYKLLCETLPHSFCLNGSIMKPFGMTNLSCVSHYKLHRCYLINVFTWMCPVRTPL